MGIDEVTLSWIKTFESRNTRMREIDTLRRQIDEEESSWYSISLNDRQRLWKKAKAHTLVYKLYMKLSDALLSFKRDDHDGYSMFLEAVTRENAIFYEEFFNKV